MSFKTLILSSLIFCLACGTTSNQEEKFEAEDRSTSLFSLVDTAHSKLIHTNPLQESEKLNILTYEYLYNGSGIAIGDINNDGLVDVFAGANFFGGRLFLNKGNLQFEDISKKAGVFKRGYSTGVSMVDINADGFLDIYICRSLTDKPEQRANLLLINNGDLTFSEQAEKYGLADKSFSNYASFFDYDKDGDLDMYLLNHRVDFKDALTIKTYTNKDGRKLLVKDTNYQYVSDRLYRNNGNHTFTDVSKQAGLINRAFGLSVTVADINSDGWMDLFVANDYADRDHFYINQQDGSFNDEIDGMFLHSSKNAMGSDIADFNNDGLLDLINLDMVAEDNYRQKQLKGQSPYDLYHLAVKYGLGHQVMRNTLQLNNGDGTFSEIAQLAGVSHTDWSWAPILADFDNDGFKDLFISNGYYRDVTDMDYLKYESNKVLQDAGGLSKVNSFDLTQKMKHNPISNYIYKNGGELKFIDKTEKWGMKRPSISSGAVYADLDQDGDLELLVNNINQPLFLYKNNSVELGENHFLNIQLKGSSKNPQAIGAKISIETDASSQMQELSPYRGYFSSHEAIVHFGIGLSEQVNFVLVEWPDGSKSQIKDVPADQLLVISQKDDAEYAINKTEPSNSFVVASNRLLP